MTIAPSAGPLFDLTTTSVHASTTLKPTIVVLSDGPGLARSDDPPTSKAAATLLKGRGTDLAKVYRALLRRGNLGHTDYENQLTTGLPANSQPTRRNQLVRMGLARATDRRRETASGRQAVVWVAVIPEAFP